MRDSSINKGLLRKIAGTQRFAVLATLYNQQPYSNLVAFAVSDDLRHMIFATDRNTQKYHNILSNNKVALLIDNRSNSQSDLVQAFAITTLGIANELEGDRSVKLVQSYLDKHPSLANFIEEHDTALINIIVTDYILARFDGVTRIHVDNTF